MCMVGLFMFMREDSGIIDTRGFGIHIRGPNTGCGWRCP